MEWSHHFAGCVATANALWLCLANCKFLHLAVYCSRNWYYTIELLWQSDVQKGSNVSTVCGQCAVQHSCEVSGLLCLNLLVLRIIQRLLHYCCAVEYPE